jgi:uncharacterized protein YdiU (UPF0061 family)
MTTAHCQRLMASVFMVTAFSMGCGRAVLKCQVREVVAGLNLLMTSCRRFCVLTFSVD